MRAAAALVLLCACASSSQPLKLQSELRLTADSYDEVIDRWTRYDSVYDWLNSIMFVHATFHSPEFRKAFSIRHPEVYGPGSEEAGRLLRTRPESNKFHEFFLSLSTTDFRWNELDQEDSIWRVTLQGDDGARIEGQVERITINGNLRVIYPHIEDFDRTYAVRFPVSIEGKKLLSERTSQVTLRITSALGEAELTWRLKPGSISTDPLPIPKKAVSNRNS